MGALSKLTAVNRILRANSENPVSSLEADGVSDTDVAVAILDETTIAVQSEGTFFNREYKTLIPDASGMINLADNILDFLPDNEDYSRKVTIRAGKLYDLDNKTYVFSGPISGEATYFYEFEDLPTQIQLWIASSAAREYQARVIGDSGIDANLAKYEMEDRIRGKRWDAMSARPNFISRPRGVNASMIHRRTYDIDVQE